MTAATTLRSNEVTLIQVQLSSSPSPAAFGQLPTLGPTLLIVLDELHPTQSLGSMAHKKQIRARRYSQHSPHIFLQEKISFIHLFIYLFIYLSFLFWPFIIQKKKPRTKQMGCFRIAAQTS
jgi:hypothetical protein